jgi:hypothetical protein
MPLRRSTSPDTKIAARPRIREFGSSAAANRVAVGERIRELTLVEKVECPNWERSFVRKAVLRQLVDESTMNLGDLCADLRL